VKGVAFCDSAHSTFGVGAQKKASLAKLLIALGPIAAFATLVSRYPRVAAMFVTLPAAAVVGFFVCGYFGLGGTNTYRFDPAAHVRTQQPSSAQSDARSTRQYSIVAREPPFGIHRGIHEAWRRCERAIDFMNDPNLRAVFFARGKISRRRPASQGMKR
jgi:hypothetical protein